MSVVFRADGTTTSSIQPTISSGNFVFKDTIPNTGIFANVPNAARVVGDGGFDYAYRRGKPRAVFSLNWTMMPETQVRDLQEIWNYFEMHHWLTIQTTDLTEKNNLFNTTVGTGVTFQGSSDGVNPMVGNATNRIFVDKWVIWSTGVNIGVKKRIVKFNASGVFTLEDALTFANGERFWIGYPARFTSPLQIGQMGNINTHYNVSVDCEVVIF